MDIIKKNIKDNIDIFIGFYFDYNLRGLKIGFQIEQTIILNENKYFCNVHLIHNHLEKDIIIEYSKPNIAHINKEIKNNKENIDLLNDYIQKVV